MEKLIYTPPMIEVIEVKVENGYAASATTNSPMWEGGKEQETWE